MEMLAVAGELHLGLIVAGSYNFTRPTNPDRDFCCETENQVSRDERQLSKCILFRSGLIIQRVSGQDAANAQGHGY